MWYVALINHDDNLIEVQESYESKDSGMLRHEMLALECQLRSRDIGGNWSAYIGTSEYSLPSQGGES